MECKWWNFNAPPRIYEVLCFDGMALFVQTGKKSSAIGTQLKMCNNTKTAARTPRRLNIYLALKWEMWHVSALYQRRRHEDCCVVHMLRVHSLQCRLLRWKTSQMLTPWVRSLNIYKRCSMVFTRTLHAVFAKHPKQETRKRLKTVETMSEKTTRNLTMKCKPLMVGLTASWLVWNIFM